MARLGRGQPFAPKTERRWLWRLTALTFQIITGVARIMHTITTTITGQSRIQKVVSTDTPNAKALSFDGVNDYAERGSISMHPGAAFSYEFKMQWGFATSSVSERGIMGDDSGNGGGNIFLQRHNERFRLYLGGYTEDSQDTPLVTGQWYDMYLAHDSLNDITYFGVDGVVRAVVNTSNHFTGASGFQLGRGYANPFKGLIDELRISTIIRHTGNFTPSEAPYTADADTRALYHANEGEGLILYDHSGNGFDLTLGADPATPSWVTGYAFTVPGFPMLGLARIMATATRTIAGVTRIMITSLQTIPGVARVMKVVTSTITGVSRIMKAVTKTITGVGNIIPPPTLQTITGVAKIKKAIWWRNAQAAWYTQGSIGWYIKNGIAWYENQ